MTFVFKGVEIQCMRGQCCSQKTCIIKQTKNNLCQAWNTSLQVYDQGPQRPQNTACCHCPECLLLLDNKTLTVMTQHTLVA